MHCRVLSWCPRQETGIIGTGWWGWHGVRAVSSLWPVRLPHFWGFWGAWGTTARSYGRCGEVCEEAAANWVEVMRGDLTPCRASTDFKEQGKVPGSSMVSWIWRGDG